MKILLNIALLFISFNSLGQGWEVRKVQFNGKEYFLYPEHQDKKYEMSIFNLEWVWKQYKRGVYKNEKFPKDGLWIQFYSEDTTHVARIFTIADSLLTGDYRAFYFEGSLKEKGLLEKGEKLGIWNYYHANGQKEAEGEYKIDTSGSYYQRVFRIGYWKSWYSNGNLKSEEYFGLENERIGQWVEYYESGSIKSISRYKNNLRDSINTEFGENGQVLISHLYEDGYIIDSLSTFYYPNGKVKKQGKLEENIPIGPWKYYFENGNLRCEGDFSHYNTTLCSSAVPRDYKLPIIQGQWISYYPDGTIQAKGHFKPVWEGISRGRIQIPMEMGYWEYFYSDGNRMACGQYENNPKDIEFQRRKWDKEIVASKIGDWKYYDTKGLISKSKDTIREIDRSINRIKKELLEKISDKE